MQSRGRDSWGATNGTELVKRLGPIEETWFDHEDQIWDWQRAIIHTRGASVGSVTVANAHPFMFHNGSNDDWKRTVVGIHNGHVANHEELDKKYPNRRDSSGHPAEVDSAHIFAAFAEGAPTSEIYGWGNLAWYEYTPELIQGRLYLMKFNADALNVVMLETGEIAFCSEILPLRRAAMMAGTRVKHPFKIEDERVYYVDPEYDSDGVWVRDRLFDTKERRVFGSRVQPMQVWEGWDSGWTGGRRNDCRAPMGYRGGTNIHNVQHEARRAGVCGVMSCENKVAKGRKNALVCDECYEATAKLVLREAKREHTSV